MSWGKSSTLCFHGRLESLLQKTCSVSFGVRMHFLLVKIGVVLAVPFNLLIIDIILLLFDASRGKLNTYDNNEFCAEM